ALITRTYEAAVNTGLFAEVIVVTDSDEIQREVEAAGGKVIRSKKEHESGTDRIAEAAADIQADVVINVQGDEPFIQRGSLEQLVNLFKGEEGREVQAASLVQPTKDRDLINNPNKVK